MILLSSDWHLIKSKDGMDIIDMEVYDTIDTKSCLIMDLDMQMNN